MSEQVSRNSVRFFVDEVVNTTGVEMADIESSYLVVEISRQELEKVKQVLPFIRSVDTLGAFRFPGAIAKGLSDLSVVGMIDDTFTDDLVDTVDNDLGTILEVSIASSLIEVSLFNGDSIKIRGLEHNDRSFVTLSLQVKDLIQAFDGDGLVSVAGWRQLPQ